MRKFIKPLILLLVLGGLIWAVVFIRGLNAKARIGVAYKAKITCSEVFVAGRNAEEVLAHDFFGIDPILERIPLQVDPDANTVSGSLYGLGKSTAYFRPGLGCALAVDGPPSPVQVTPVNMSPETLPTVINPEVQTAAEALFNDDALAHPIVTRGVVVLQGGTVVAEYYADGFTPDTPQQSWSMAKSITHALYGIAAKDGLVTINDTHLMPDWQGEDPRAEISLDALMKMSSGLAFDEDYAGVKSDVNLMLFNRRDMGGYAASRPLLYAPKTEWAYSSGTTNILSKVLRTRLEAAGEDYHSYPQRKLFAPLGIASATFETDPDGTFVGSSYLYASPRDWAKLGQLYLQDGVWNGTQILPEGWTEYARTPALSNTPYYGAQWWLNQDQGRLPGLPKTAFMMGGHDGQYVIVLPSKDAVIVRLGILRPPATFEQDLGPLIEALYKTLPTPPKKL